MPVRVSGTDNLKPNLHTSITLGDSLLEQIDDKTLLLESFHSNGEVTEPYKVYHCHWNDQIYIHIGNLELSWNLYEFVPAIIRASEEFVTPKGRQKRKQNNDQD